MMKGDILTVKKNPELDPQWDKLVINLPNFME